MPAGAGITLCVPTMNRPEFVDRLLRYYAGQGFAGRIAIGDSSGPTAFEQTRQAISQVGHQLDVAHIEAEGLSVGRCLKRLFEHTATPYAAVVPDDDFIVPTAMERCASFLAGHPDYVAAHGAGVTVTLDTNGLHGQVAFCGHYPLPALEADSPSQRLRDHLARYLVTLFSVYRTESWRAMLRDVEPLEDAAFSNEVLPCCLSVVLGKVKELEGLYLVRQSHAKRVQLPTMFDWIATPARYPSYAATLEILAQALVSCEGVEPAAARTVVKDAIREYIGSGLGLRRNWGRDEWVLRVARQAWQVVQALRPTPEAQWSLSALLKPSSPYHADFMPVYTSLVNPPGGPGIGGANQRGR